MFSTQRKREISDAVQKILRATGHPELPETEIQFHLHVDGAASWSYADIKNNGAVVDPETNQHNEEQEKFCCPHGALARNTCTVAKANDCESRREGCPK